MRKWTNSNVLHSQNKNCVSESRVSRNHVKQGLGAVQNQPHNLSNTKERISFLITLSNLAVNNTTTERQQQHHVRKWTNIDVLLLA